MAASSVSRAISPNCGRVSGIRWRHGSRPRKVVPSRSARSAEGRREEGEAPVEAGKTEAPAAQLAGYRLDFRRAAGVARSEGGRPRDRRIPGAARRWRQRFAASLRHAGKAPRSMAVWRGSLRYGLALSTEKKAGVASTSSTNRSPKMAGHLFPVEVP